VAGADVLDQVENLELFADPAMVPATRFFELVLVFGQFFGGFEEGAVDSLKLRILFAAAPVGAGDAHELECADLAGVADVAAAAEVREFGVRALRDAAFFQVGEEVELEGLTGPLLVGLGLAQARHHEPVLPFMDFRMRASSHTRSSGVSDRGSRKS
jgi:hypothetical protein